MAEAKVDGLLSALANPVIPDPVGGFQRGREKLKGREFDESLKGILKNSIGSQWADTIDIDPRGALSIAQAVGVPTNDAARMKNLAGTMDFFGKLLQVAPPGEAGALLAEQAQQLASKGIDTTFMMESAQNLMSGNPELIQKEVSAWAQLGGPGKFSAKTEILEDGSSIQTTTKGKTIVKDPTGKVVTGKDAAAVIRAGAEEGIRIQTARAGGRAEATGEEKRASALITRGESAAESTAGIRRGIELLGVIETGGVNAISLAVKNRLGIEGADEGELSSSLGKAILSQLRETFGAAFTETEGARLERIEANIGKSTASNIRLLTQALKIAERTTRRAIKVAKARGQDDVVADLEDLLTFSLSIDEGAAPSAGRFKIEVLD